MWMMSLMSNKWYARELGSRHGLRDALGDLFTLVNEGTVVAICDDVETFCDEMGVNQADVIMPGDDDDE